MKILFYIYDSGYYSLNVNGFFIGLFDSFGLEGCRNFAVRGMVSGGRLLLWIFEN